MSEEIDREIEEEIDRVLEKKLEDGELEEGLQQQEVDRKLDEKLKDMDPDAKEGLLKNIEKEENVSRRSFLKMLGLGAGGLALSSSASAVSFTKLTGGSGGGGGSSRDVKRDHKGDVKWTQAGIDSTANKTSTGSHTLGAINTTSDVVHERLEMKGFDGEVKFYRGGVGTGYTALTTKSLTTGAGTTAYNIPNTSGSTSWYAVADITQMGGTSAKTYQPGGTRKNGSWSYTHTYSGGADTVKWRFVGDYYLNYATLTFYVNGNQQGTVQPTKTGQTTTYYTAQGSFSSPANAKMHISGGGPGSHSVTSLTATFYGGASTVTPQFTASRNQFYTIP